MGVRGSVDYRGMLEDLLQIESGLSDWEENFIDSLSRWEDELTDRQKAALNRVWCSHCLHQNTGRLVNG